MADDIQDIGTNTIIFREQPNWVDTPRADFFYSRDIPEYPSSSMDILIHTTKIPRRFEYTYNNLSKQMEFDLLTFCAERKGRLGSFWLLGWGKELQVTQDMAGGTQDIVYENNEFIENFQGYERIYLLLNNGDLITRHLTSVVYFDPQETQLYSVVSTVWDRNILVSDIKHAGRLFYVRLDNDEFSMSFDKIDISEISLRFKELVEEYPA